MEALSLPGKGDRIIKGHSEKQNFRPPGPGDIAFTASYYKGNKQIT